MTQDYPFSGTNHITITVRDMEKSLHFYRDMVGLRVSGERSSKGAPNSHLYGGNASHRLVTLDMGGGPGLALTEYPKAKGEGILLDDVGITHFSLTVSNIKEFTERMLAMGAKPAGPTDAAFFKDPFFIDPDGILVQFNGPGGFQIPQDQGGQGSTG